jgi:hypothetical protein
MRLVSARSPSLPGGRYRAQVRRLDTVPAPVRIGLVAASMLAISLTAAFASGAAQPVDLLLAGNRIEARHVLAQDFGARVDRDRSTYDGTYVYLEARYFPDVRAAAKVVPGARYRLMHLLPAALAAVGGSGTPVVLLLALLGVAGVGLAAGALADLAARHGRDPRVGYAAAVSLVLPVLLSTPEPLAFGLAFAGLALADRRRYWPATGLFALAGLARQTSLTLAVVAVCLAWWRRDRTSALAMGVLAVAPTATWWVALHQIIATGDYTPLALLGFRDASGLTGLDVGASVAVLALTLLAIWRWRDVPPLWLVGVAFLAWFLVYDQSTYDWRALPRVSAPSLALGLAALVSRARDRRAPA